MNLRNDASGKPTDKMDADMMGSTSPRDGDTVAPDTVTAIGEGD